MYGYIDPIMTWHHDPVVSMSEDQGRFPGGHLLLIVVFSSPSLFSLVLQHYYIQVFMKWYEWQKITLHNLLWPSANKDSSCWGQDITNNIFKSIKYIGLSSCIFKMIGPEEICWKFHGNRTFRPEVINSRRLLKLRKTLVFVWQTFISLYFI